MAPARLSAGRAIDARAATGPRGSRDRAGRYAASAQASSASDACPVFAGRGRCGAPAAVSRIPSSMSSIEGTANRLWSNPPISSNASSANGTDPAPEGRRGAAARSGGRDGGAGFGTSRDDTGGCGRVVVGAEQRDQLVLLCEGGADPAERVRVNFDVGVDEDEYVALRFPSAGIPGRGRPGTGGLAYDEDLLRGVGGAANRRGAAAECRRVVRGRHDRGQGQHGLILVDARPESPGVSARLLQPVRAAPRLGKGATARFSRPGGCVVARLDHHLPRHRTGPPPLCIDPELFQLHVESVLIESMPGRSVRGARRGRRAPTGRLVGTHLR